MPRYSGGDHCILRLDDSDICSDNDGACSDGKLMFRASQPRISAGEKFVSSRETRFQELGNGLELAFNPYAPRGVLVINQKTQSRLQAFALPDLLREQVDLALVEQNLILPAGFQPTLTFRKPLTLTAWFHMADACPLRCNYCYIPRTGGRMTEGIGRRLIDALFCQATARRFTRVKIKYAGGEPLLAFDVVASLHRYATEKSQITGIKTEGLLLTSGVGLSQEQAGWMAAVGLRVMVSLDGLDPVSSRQRNLVAGGPSFIHAAHALDVLLSNGIHPVVTITLTRWNLSGLPELVSYLIDRDITFTFNFFRPTLSAVEPDSFAFRDDEMIDAIRRALQVLETRLPTAHSFAGLLDRVYLGAPHTRACGSGFSYLVFDPDGRATSCQMNLHEAKSFADDASLGALLNNKELGDLLPKMHTDCTVCPWRYTCAGGCPLLTTSTGKAQYCEIYKALIPDILRLEGLRLVKKWQEDLLCQVHDRQT